MKRNNVKSLFALVAMVAIMLAPIFGHALVTNANPAHPGIADETTPRVITVWKYGVENLDEAGERGDGTQPPNLPGVPVPGIRFEVFRVIPVGNASLTNPLLQVEGTHWTFDPAFSRMEVTTGADGSAVFNLGTGRSADGIYLVREMQDNRDAAAIAASGIGRIIRPVDPFFVQMPQTRREGTGELTTLLYHVHVYPKNVPQVSLEPNKTVDGRKYLSVMAGQAFSWELTANIPNDMVHTVPAGIYTLRQTQIVGGQTVHTDIPVTPGDRIPAYMFEFRDVLSPHLTLLTAPTAPASAPRMQYTLDGGTTWIDLTAAQFTMTAPSAANNNTVTFALTDQGMKDIDEAQTTPGPGRVNAQIRAVFYTRVNPVEVPSAPGDETFNGILCNTFGVYYIGPDWQLPPGTPPPDGEYPDEDDHPIYAVGGINIVKTDESREVATGALAGAEFHIAVSEAYAREGRFLANNGNSYLRDATGNPTGAAAGVSFLVSTSDAQGRVTFRGLPLNFAPGFNPEYILPVPSPFPSALPGHAVADTWIYRNFWLVETVAPSGFELLRNPVLVRVTTNTHLNVIGVEIPNQAITFLPFTGGMGTAILVLLAIAVIGTGTGALVYDKKRRRS